MQVEVPREGGTVDSEGDPEGRMTEAHRELNQVKRERTDACASRACCAFSPPADRVRPRFGGHPRGKEGRQVRRASGKHCVFRIAATSFFLKDP